MNKIIKSKLLTILTVILAYSSISYAHLSLEIGTQPSAYWMQLSNEYKSSTISLYKLAKIALDENLKNTDKSAFLNQTKDFSTLPPAIIMDIDETVLDNSSYALYMAKNKNTWYSAETWEDYINQSNATAMYGSLDFIKYAQSKNVVIYFVTNRNFHQKAATIKNLKKVGINFKNLENQTLFLGEKENWGSNKFTRYEEIAKTHRIVMIVGDSFNDFVPSRKITYKQYQKLFNKHQDMIGQYWIQTLSPLYGYWNEFNNLDSHLNIYNPSKK